MGLRVHGGWGRASEKGRRFESLGYVALKPTYARGATGLVVCVTILLDSQTLKFEIRDEF